MARKKNKQVSLYHYPRWVIIACDSALSEERYWGAWKAPADGVTVWLGKLGFEQPFLKAETQGELELKIKKYER